MLKTQINHNESWPRDGHAVLGLGLLVVFGHKISV